jgi:hypothetical protein
MIRRSPSLRLIGRVAALSSLAVAGLVSAQPAPPVSPSAQPTQPTAPPLIQSPPPGSAVPPASLPEEAPPAEVAPPPPVPTPPVQATEVAPAAPPKAQVAEKPEEPTTKRARYDIAVLQAIDKITAESMRFEAAVGKPVRYKNLIFTVKACERAAPDEPMDDSIAYLTIDSQPVAAPGKPAPPPRQAFRGWMYAASPGLNPLEHPVYDAWVITCRAATPSGAALAPKPAPAPPAAASPAPPRSRPAPVPPPEDAEAPPPKA